MTKNYVYFLPPVVGKPGDEDLKKQSFAPVLRLREYGREGGDATLYTESEEVGGACTGGRSLWMAQKLAALTPLSTQTCTHTAEHTPTQRQIVSAVAALIVMATPDSPGLQRTTRVRRMSLLTPSEDSSGDKLKALFSLNYNRLQLKRFIVQLKGKSLFAFKSGRYCSGTTGFVAP